MFRSLTEERLLQAAGGRHLLQLEPGEELARQGEALDGFYLVPSGELRVLLSPVGDGAPLDIARFRAGQTVGIGDVLLNRPASATLTAVAKLTVIRFEPRFLGSSDDPDRDQTPEALPGNDLLGALTDPWPGRVSICELDRAPSTWYAGPASR
ncbi:MAG: cyclic nucleotide-binding domain-containing protein [Candidatus Riflebacteria bacterium]|nr:cyclic nucleotide-binding domain-containing protein [Candidatus Riflebacteria bacterium]